MITTDTRVQTQAQRFVYSTPIVDRLAICHYPFVVFKCTNKNSIAQLKIIILNALSGWLQPYTKLPS